MYRLLPLICCVLLTGTSLALAAPLAAAEWKLVWSDEFDRPGPPDPSKWSY
jgi:hypothetical protein